MKDLQVKIVSTEYVKPSIPTSTHKKTFNLCYMDQMLPLNPPFLSSILVFYPNTQAHQPLDIITRLKTSLSRTLTSFYPLAGRVKQSSISCNDQGLPFFEAHVNCPLSLVLSSPQILELATKFLPPRESLCLMGVNDGDGDADAEVVECAIQISIFTCGGVAIGWYDIHKVMDGSSASIFIKHWAALSSQQQCYDDEGLVQPDYDAPVAAFPPVPTPELLRFGNNENSSSYPSIVVKSFIFKNHSIVDLQAKASSEHVPNPSRYEALAGFIWEQLQLVSTKKTTGQLPQYENSDTVFQVTLNMRPFTNPPLPKGSIGNLFDTTIARAETSAKLPVPELVARIHEAVSKKKGEIKECYRGEKGVEAVRASWDKRITTALEYKGRAYRVTSWCKLGFSDLDFGFGKPIRMIPAVGVVSQFHKNLVILTDFFDSKGEAAGIEAWFFLEENDMRLLESNPEFLAFASPL